MRSLARSLVSRYPREIRIKRRCSQSNIRYLDQGALNDVAESKFLGRFCAHRKCRQIENSSLRKPYSGTNVDRELLNTCSMRARQNYGQLFIDKSSKLCSILMNKTAYVFKPCKKLPSRLSNNSLKKKYSPSSSRYLHTDNMVKLKKNPNRIKTSKHSSNEKLYTLHKIYELNNQLLSRKIAIDINKSMSFSKRTYCDCNLQCGNVKECDNCLDLIDQHYINHLNETSILSHCGSGGKLTSDRDNVRVCGRKSCIGKSCQKLISLLSYCKNKCRLNEMYNQKNTYSWRKPCTRTNSQNDLSTRSLNGLMNCLENIECPEWRHYNAIIKINSAQPETRFSEVEVKSKVKARTPPVKRNAKQKSNKTREKRYDLRIRKSEDRDVHYKHREKEVSEVWPNECCSFRLPTTQFSCPNPDIKSKAEEMSKRNSFFQTVESKERVQVKEGSGDNYFNSQYWLDDSEKGKCSNYGGGDSKARTNDETSHDSNAYTDLKILEVKDPLLCQHEPRTEIGSDPYTEYSTRNAKRYSDKVESAFSSSQFSSFPKSNWRSTLLKPDDKLSQVMNVSNPKIAPCPIKVSSDKNPNLSEYSRITVAIDNVRKRIVNAVRFANVGNNEDKNDSSAKPDQYKCDEIAKSQNDYNNEIKPNYLDRLNDEFRTPSHFQPPSSVHLNEVIEAIKDNRRNSYKVRNNTKIDKRFKNRNTYSYSDHDKYHTYANEIIVNTVLLNPWYQFQNVYNGARNFSKPFRIDCRSYSQSKSNESVDELIDRIIDDYGSKRQDQMENQRNFEQEFTSVNGKNDTSKHTFSKVKYLAENRNCQEELENKTYNEFTKEHSKDKSEYPVSSEHIPGVVTRYHQKHRDSKQINGNQDNQHSCTNGRKWKAWNPEEWKSDNSKLHSEIMAKGFYSSKSECVNTDNQEKDDSDNDCYKKSIQSRVKPDENDKTVNVAADNGTEMRYNQCHPTKADHPLDNNFDCYNVGDLGLNFTSFELEKPDIADDKHKNKHKNKSHQFKKIVKSAKACHRPRSSDTVKTKPKVNAGIIYEVNNSNNRIATKKNEHFPFIRLRNSFSMDSRPSLRTQLSTNKLNLRQASSRTGSNGYTNYEKLKKIKKIDKVDYTREEKSLSDKEIVESIKIKESYFSPPTKPYRDSFVDNYGMCSKEVERKKKKEFDDTAISSKHISEEMKISGQFPDGKRTISNKWSKVFARPKDVITNDEKRPFDIESVTSNSVNAIIKQPHPVQHLKATVNKPIVNREDDLKNEVDRRSNIANKKWTTKCTRNTIFGKKVEKERRYTSKYEEDDDKLDKEREFGNQGLKSNQPEEKEKKYFVELRTLNKNIRNRITKNRLNSLDTNDELIKPEQRSWSTGKITKLIPQVKPQSNEIPVYNEAKSAFNSYFTKKEKNQEVFQDSTMKDDTTEGSYRKPDVQNIDHRTGVIDNINQQDQKRIEDDMKEVGTDYSRSSKTSQYHLEPKATGESKYKIDSEDATEGFKDKLSVTCFKQFPVLPFENNFTVEATMLKVTKERISSINRLSNKNVVETQSLDILSNQVEQELNEDIITNFRYIKPRFKKNTFAKSLMSPKEHFSRIMNTDKALLNYDEVDQDMNSIKNNKHDANVQSYNISNTTMNNMNNSQRTAINGKGIAQQNKADVNASNVVNEVCNPVDIEDNIQAINISKGDSSSENTQTEPNEVSLLENQEQVKGDDLSTPNLAAQDCSEMVATNDMIKYQNNNKDLALTVTGVPQEVTLVSSTNVLELPREKLVLNIAETDESNRENEEMAQLNMEGTYTKSEVFKVNDLSKEEHLKGELNEQGIQEEEFSVAKDSVKIVNVQGIVPTTEDATKETNKGYNEYDKALNKSTQKHGMVKTSSLGDNNLEANPELMASSFHKCGVNDKKNKHFYNKRENTLIVAEYNRETDLEEELQRIIFENSEKFKVPAKVEKLSRPSSAKKRPENIADRKKYIGKNAENKSFFSRKQSKIQKEAQIRQKNYEENEMTLKNHQLLDQINLNSSDIDSSPRGEWVTDMCNPLQQLNDANKKDKEENSKTDGTGLIEAAVMASDSNENQVDNSNETSDNWPENLVRKKDPVIKQPLSPSKPPSNRCED